MKKVITSLQNENIKEVVRLRATRSRKASHLTLVEGVKEVLRALESKAAFQEVYWCRDYLKKYDKAETLIKKLLLLRMTLFEVSEKVFDKISFGDRKEGVLAVCKPNRLNLDDFSKYEGSFYVLLEGIEKPGNLGAIFRTCDGAGVDGIILCDGCSDPYNPSVVRASMATLFTVPFVIAANAQARAFLQSKKITLYAASPEAKSSYFQKDFTKPSAIVLGNEHAGLSEFWRGQADEKIKVPMRGYADSLNVSSTAAILIYERLRQKMIKYKQPGV